MPNLAVKRGAAPPDPPSLVPDEAEVGDWSLVDVGSPVLAEVCATGSAKTVIVEETTPAIGTTARRVRPFGQQERRTHDERRSSAHG